MKLKIKYIEWIIFCIFIFALPFVTVLMDVGIISPPPFAVQRTGNNDIYRTLFEAQASMVGVVLAIIALLISRINARYYGLSLMRYIMNLKPSPAFRHGSIIIQLITITALSWASVAINFNNLAVALFAYTIVLLIYLATGVIKAILSGDSIKNEIRDFLLEKKDIEHTLDLLHELDENIVNGNIALFRHNYGFALETIWRLPITTYQREDIEKFESIFLTITRTTREVRFIKAMDVLDLCVRFMEASTKDNNDVFFRNLMGYEAYQLLSEIHFEDISRMLSLLRGWQESDFKNEIKYTKSAYYRNRISIASSIYHHIDKNVELASDDKEKIFVGLLEDAHYLLKHNDDNKDIAEKNFISYVVSLLKDKQISILESLIGGKSKLDGILYNRKYATGHTNHFVHSRVNIFIVLYMYYLAYREKFINDDDRVIYQYLLSNIAVAFWDNIDTGFLNRNHSSFNFTNKDYMWFGDLLHQYEIYPPPNEDGISSRISSYDTILLDFCAFCLTRTTQTVEELEKGLMAMLIDEKSGHYRDMFLLFNPYVEHDLKSRSRYIEFCSIFKNTYSINDEDVDTGYEKLKTTSINLYRKEKLQKALLENTEFIEEQSQHEIALNAVLNQAINDFCSHFSKFDEEDAIVFRDYSSREGVPISIVKSHYSGDTEHYAKQIIRNLNHILVDRLLNENALCLEETTRKDGTALMFLNKIKGMDVDLLLGFDSFRYNDPDYTTYNDVVGEFEKIEGIDADIHAAISSKHVKIEIKNAEVRIRNADEKTKKNWHESGDAMRINKISISLTENENSDFIDNYFRIIELRLDLAIGFANDIVGGGLLYKKVN